MGLSDEMYDSIMVLGGLNNVLYYCDTNNCISHIKQLLFTFLNLEKLDKPDQSQPIVQQEGLSKQLDDLSQKIADLPAKQLTLQQSVQNISSSITDSTTQMETNLSSPVSSPGGALDIVDEMADRDRRKHNIAVYNLTEGNDRKTDIETFKALSSGVFKLDVNITKVIRLGPKITNKQRPLLLILEDINDKIYLLSHSHF